MEIIDLLNWRYAAKKMNGQVIPQEKVDIILETARLTPTSSGLQPFNVIVITNQAMKDKIRAISYNQSIVSECSHLLVFAAWDTYTPERINEMFDLVNEVRGFKNEGWENYRNQLLKNYPQKDPEINFNHAAKQAYIALGMAMVAAAEVQVDSTPMEGFEATALDEILNLRAQGLRSVVMLPIGYREASGDWLVNLKKVRRSRDKFIIEVK
jgi:nitroreductase/dihydropteridine reductase